MKSIALILPFFGNMNSGGYFDLFLKTCGNNKDIDFYIYTDDKTNYEYPPNVYVTYITFSEIKNIVQKCFDFQIVLDAPYKLCDYKVAYGEIFRKDIEKYDYWGYIDCDVLFGDIRHFLTDEILNKYDKIYTNGHMTLFKNIPEITALYRTVIENGFNTNYIRAFTSPEIFAIDEWGRNGGINRIFKNENKKIYNEYDYDDLSSYRTGFRPEQKRMNPPYYEMRRNAYVCENGKIIRYSDSYGELNKEEVIYVHFQKRCMQNRVKNKEKFIVYPNVFDEYQNIDIEFLRKLSLDKLNIKMLISRRYKRIVSIIRNFRKE